MRAMRTPHKKAVAPEKQAEQAAVTTKKTEEKTPEEILEDAMSYNLGKRQAAHNVFKNVRLEGKREEKEFYGKYFLGILEAESKKEKQMDLDLIEHAAEAVKALKEVGAVPFLQEIKEKIGGLLALPHEKEYRGTIKMHTAKELRRMGDRPRTIREFFATINEVLDYLRFSKGPEEAVRELEAEKGVAAP